MSVSSETTFHCVAASDERSTSDGMHKSRFDQGIRGADQSADLLCQRARRAEPMLVMMDAFLPQIEAAATIRLLSEEASGSSSKRRRVSASSSRAVLEALSDWEAQCWTMAACNKLMGSLPSIVLPAHWAELGHPTVECQNCGGIYTMNASGKIRKHKCIVPLSALSSSALISKRPLDNAEDPPTGRLAPSQ
mmetsp:Transcript_28843/g.58041  ORF Transcript_28843/g.58041 Transcript_28843/m.58041 type:complete len:192 (-) Transcript_28843:84-659(-)